MLIIIKIKATDRVWVASLVGWEGQLDGSKAQFQEIAFNY